jgi:ketosteroid isomerase-like protein
MKKVITLFSAISFVLVNLTVSFAQQPALSVEQDKAAIKKTLDDAARAIMDFPRTRDIEGNLRFYAEEFFEIRDGKLETRADVRQYLGMILEDMRLGKTPVFSVQYSNISINANGSLAWASYDMALKYGAAGTLTTALDKKCTSIFRRSGSGWLFVHDHCSTVKAPHSLTPRMDNNL